MPPVIGRVYGAGAEIVDPDSRGREVIEVCVDLGCGCVEGDVDCLIVKDILRDDRAGDGRSAEDIDTGWTGGRGVPCVCSVAGDAIADNDVVVEIDRRRRRWRRAGVVHGDAGQTVIVDIVVDDYVAGSSCAGERREDSDACAGAGKLKAIMHRVIVSDGVVCYSKGDLCGRYHGCSGAVRSHGDAAVPRIVMDVVALDEVVVAGSGFVADEEASRVMVGLIPNHKGMIDPNEVNALAAVVALVSFKGGNAGARGVGDIQQL